MKWRRIVSPFEVVYRVVVYSALDLLCWSAVGIVSWLIITEGGRYPLTPIIKAILNAE
jgi:hypothetical protein